VGSDELGTDDSSRIEPVEAVAAVNRILASRAFERSARSRDFLSYVTSEVMAGRGEKLHERRVGLRALARGPDFDGRSDASVRVQAHRVRAALDAYYADEGSDDLLVVSLPPGSYVPEFSRITTRPAPAAQADVAPASVGVVQFRSAGEPVDDLLAVLVQTLTRCLARIPDLRVAGPSHQPRADVADVARGLGVRFVLWGEATAGGRQVTLFLAEGMTGQLLWSESAGFEMSDDVRMAAVEAWASAVAAHLGDYAGVILREALLEDGADVSSSITTNARVSFYRHIVDGGAATLQRARDDLAEARAAGTAASDVHAMYAFVVAAGIHYRLSTDVDADLADATGASRLALRRDPRSALAHLALSLVAVSRAEGQTASHHAATAVDLAPDHPSTLYSAGAILSILGQRSEGSALMRRSFALNPVHPAYQHANLAFERLLAGDYPGALVEASIVDEGGLMWGPFCRALALAGLGRIDEGRREFVDAVRHEPELAHGVQTGLGDTFVEPHQLAHLVALAEMLDDDEIGSDPPDEAEGSVLP
jgi:TolB-like protein